MSSLLFAVFLLFQSYVYGTILQSDTTDKQCPQKLTLTLTYAENNVTGTINVPTLIELSNFRRRDGGRNNLLILGRADNDVYSNENLMLFNSLSVRITFPKKVLFDEYDLDNNDYKLISTEKGNKLEFVLPKSPMLTENLTHVSGTSVYDIGCISNEWALAETKVGDQVLETEVHLASPFKCKDYKYPPGFNPDVSYIDFLKVYEKDFVTMKAYSEYYIYHNGNFSKSKAYVICDDPDYRVARFVSVLSNGTEEHSV